MRDKIPEAQENTPKMGEMPTYLVYISHKFTPLHLILTTLGTIGGTILLPEAGFYILLPLALGRHNA
jgi:hypothetical protein